jgi:fructose-bisphosphate aldolase class II
MQNTAYFITQAGQLGLAVPAFNVPYLPMMSPIIRAAVDQDAVVLIEVARLEWIKFESQSPAAVMAEFKKCNPPSYVRLHLDHTPVIDEDNLKVDYLSLIQEAIELGYQSVMVDGSRLSLAENIEVTQQVVKLARKAGIPCEAELGAVLGHETGPLPPYEELFASGKGFTDIAEAERFVKETGCDWLSVAIGNIHGAVSKATRNQKKIEARLNLAHLERLRQVVGIPLVLHGGSGLKQEDVLEAIKRGIAKVNIGTEVRQAYESACRTSGSVAAAQQAVYERAVWLIRDYLHLAGTRRLIMEQAT